MEPQYKTPAVEEHALFADTLQELKEWLEMVTGLTEGPKSAPIPNPDPHAKRANYDGEKLKGYLESMIDPLMDHVRSLPFNVVPLVEWFIFHTVVPRNRVSRCGENQIERSHAGAVRGYRKGLN